MKRNLTPSRKAILAVTTDLFLTNVRETEFVRNMGARLELASLVADDPVYHPLGVTA